MDSPSLALYCREYLKALWKNLTYFSLCNKLAAAGKPQFPVSVNKDEISHRLNRTIAYLFVKLIKEVGKLKLVY